MDNFRQVVEDCGIVNIGYLEFPFTWCNNFISPHSTRARLDRALSGKDWKDCYPDSWVHHLSTNTSDHLPLHLILGTKSQILSKATRRFHFEQGWFLYNESKLVV
ncbi:hypothetical protein LIER_15939 [Lithospermum erythrorhizon]|uniref:Uncharacterized protein n=1 Tax=Lithospermum erythrorhizon TaxID=34254 RepID=A0AAV3Q4P5_LITER